MRKKKNESDSRKNQMFCKIQFKKLLLTMVLLFVPSMSLAGLVIQDYQIAGDNLLTLDTNTGLEWLDFTETANWGTPLPYLNDGFRYATRNEVDSLFNTANLGPYYLSNPSEQNVPGVTLLLNYMGQTSYFLSEGYHLEGPATRFVFDPSMTPDGPEYYVGMFGLDISSSPNKGWIEGSFYPGYLSTFTVFEDQIGPGSDYAHALVREVPTPSSLFLFGSAILGFSLQRYRFRNSRNH